MAQHNDNCQSRTLTPRSRSRLFLIKAKVRAWGSIVLNLIKLILILIHYYISIYEIELLKNAPSTSLEISSFSMRFIMYRLHLFILIHSLEILSQAFGFFISYSIICTQRYKITISRQPEDLPALTVISSISNPII